MDRARERVKGAKTDAGRLDALIDEAELLAEIGDFEAARERAADAAESPRAALTRARVEFGARRLDRAKEFLERAAACKDGAILRAEVELLRGDGDAALASLDGVDAQDPHAAILRARATALRGYTAQALEMLATIAAKLKAPAPDLRWRLSAARADFRVTLNRSVIERA